MRHALKLFTMLALLTASISLSAQPVCGWQNRERVRKHMNKAEYSVRAGWGGSPFAYADRFEDGRLIGGDYYDIIFNPTIANAYSDMIGSVFSTGAFTGDFNWNAGRFWNLSATMALGMLAGCGGSQAAAPAADAAAPAATEEKAEEPAADEAAATDAEAPAGDNVINLYAFTDEIPNMVQKFLDTHPDFGYEVKPTIIATTDGAYQPALDQALAAGEVDMYAAEAAFVLKYCQGDAAQYAAPYKDLGIDVDAKLKEADIAQYISEQILMAI